MVPVDDERCSRVVLVEHEVAEVEVTVDDIAVVRLDEVAYARCNTVCVMRFMISVDIVVDQHIDTL